jgi:hypothetical protein
LEETQEAQTPRFVVLDINGITPSFQEESSQAKEDQTCQEKDSQEESTPRAQSISVSG